MGSVAGSDGEAGFFWINDNGSDTLPRVGQTLTGFSVGQAYTLTFWARSVILHFPDDPLEVQIDVVTAFPGLDTRIDDWTEFSFDFDAASTEHTIEWATENAEDAHPRNTYFATP
ncbi:MAG: hypothetical protein ACOCX1_00630 [Fimbriimonadaceae bacterium]